MALQAAEGPGSVSTRIDGPVTVALQRRTDADRWLTLRERQRAGRRPLRPDVDATAAWAPRRCGCAPTWAGGHRRRRQRPSGSASQARFDPTGHRE